MHLARPIAQAIENQASHHRFVGIQRVAAAGVVGVVAVWFEQIVGIVREPAQRQCRAVGIAFRGVVVDHVENHLDAGAMQRLHHVAELVERADAIAADAVGRMRRKEHERLVSPEVHEPRRRGLLVEREHRQQFDRGHAERLQVRNLVDDAGERAAPRDRHAGTRITRKAADVQFVNDAARERRARRRVVLPVVAAGIDHHALERGTRVIAGPRRRITAAPRRPRDRLRVRIEQQFLSRSNRRPLVRFDRTVRAVSIVLTRGDTRNERMPIVVRAMDARRRARSRATVSRRQHDRTDTTPPRWRASRTR